MLLTFALHVMALSCLTGSSQNNYWFLYLLILGVVVYYFYQKSILFKAVSWYVFALFYAYIGLNMLLVRVIDAFHFSEFMEFIATLIPFYVIGSIILFIKLIKDFKKTTNVSK